MIDILQTACRKAGFSMKVTAAGRRGGTDPIAKLNARREIFVKKDIIDSVLQRQIMIYGFLEAIVDSFKSDVLGKDTSERAAPSMLIFESLAVLLILIWFPEGNGQLLQVQRAQQGHE